MKYDLDKIIDRSGSGDLKHEALLPRWGRKDLLPLWVADMDFETPAFITDAIKARLEHSLFGYTVEPEDFLPSIMDWVRDHHQWDVKREWIRFIPGIVKGIGMVINVFTKEDEKVIIQPPVYHPFRLTPEGNGREVVFNPLKMREDGYYEMDFGHLEKVCYEKCKVFILCNPHNPGGITWDRETLQRLADFCYEHHLIVISDEIHADMAIFGHKHIPGIRPLRPQASFLVWLNCRDLHLNHEQLLDLFIDMAHLALNDGEMFGPGGEGFMRLNVASPRMIIRQALEQWAEAVGNLS